MTYYTNNHTMKLRRSTNFLPRDERTRMRIPFQSFIDMDFESFFPLYKQPVGWSKPVDVTAALTHEAWAT